MMEAIIEPVPPPLGEDQKRLMTIHFECIVRAFDVGYITPESGFLHYPKPHSPQWFKLMIPVTLEAIKCYDEYKLGCIIKDAYKQLESTINQYEKQ